MLRLDVNASLRDRIPQSSATLSPQSGDAYFWLT